MSTDLFMILIINLVTFVFTTIMAIAGVGAAFIVIPLIYYFGYDFLAATAMGLLLNTFSTGSASIRHARNHVIDYHIALPIIIASVVTTPIGALFSDRIPRTTLRFYFALFLLFVGTNILVKTVKQFKKEKNENNSNSLDSNDPSEEISRNKRIVISVLVGIVVGFIAGLLGVGGGSLILPFLLYFGLETKRAAGTTSFIVVFSSLLGFVSKIGLTSIELDWILTLSLVITTIIAALLGSYLMHYKLNKHQIKLTIAVMLLLVAMKIIYDLGVTYNII